MSNPAAQIGDVTASGDFITGPGVPTVMIGGIPASVMADQIAGAAGSIIAGSVTVQIGGSPAVRDTNNCVGVSTVGSASSKMTAVGVPIVEFSCAGSGNANTQCGLIVTKLLRLRNPRNQRAKYHPRSLSDF